MTLTTVLAEAQGTRCIWYVERDDVKIGDKLDDEEGQPWFVIAILRIWKGPS